MARKLECEKWEWTSLASWVTQYTMAKAKRQSWLSNVKKKWKKKGKIIKSVQETKKNVVGNLFFHEFIGNFKLKTKGTPTIFK